ncbi:MAG: hypothetical protein AUG51_09040 [Acidobacteria bacterium 13_1_20CM_3_53_8]|nr:MAG: hypothetical protein AUG51_09040 [Acidobacteria bacterium 13_1_20CM_3_53_8]
MIKSFNSYSVYCYFLPGFVLLAMLWLPIILFEGRWPQADFFYALVAIIAAYIIGHILQAVAESAIPSTMKDVRGLLRFPSDVLLDAAPETFPLSYREQLAQIIKKRFDVDVNPHLDRANATNEELNAVSSNRSAAFSLCRSALRQNKIAYEAEKLELLSTMMRGLAVAFGLGAVCHVGWATARLLRPAWEATTCLIVGALLLVGVVGAIIITEQFRPVRENLGRGKRSFLEKILTLIVIVIVFWALVGEFGMGVMTQRWPWVLVAMGLTIALLARFIPEAPKSERLSIWIARAIVCMKVAPIVITFLALGYSLGSSDVADLEDRSKLGLIILVGLLFSLRCFTSYRSFSLKFPKAIYRDFYNYERFKGEGSDRDDQV